MAIQHRDASYNVGTRYNIILDGQGYIIKEGTYNESEVPFSVPRFATGDPSLSDFSHWQYRGQTDWTFGLGRKGGQKYFVDPSKFKDSSFIEIDNRGEIRLLRPLELLKDLGTGTVAQIQSFNEKSYFGLQISGGSSEIWEYDGSADPTKLICLSSVGGSGVSALGDFVSYRDKLQFPTYSSQLWYSWDGTNFLSSSVPSKPKLRYNTEWDGKLYGRDNTRLESYNGSGNVSASGSWNTEFDTYDLHLTRAIIFHNKLYIMGIKRSLTTTACPYSILLVYDGNAWEEIGRFPNLGSNNIEVYDGKLWFCSGKYLYSFNGIEIQKELDLTDYYPSNALFGGSGFTLRKISEKLYFIVWNTDTSDIFINNGYGWYKWGERPTDASTYFTSIGNMDKLTDDLILVGDQAGKVWKLSAGYSTGDTGYLESSWFDFDLFAIEKVYSAMSVYYKGQGVSAFTDGLPTNTTITMKYKIDEDTAWSILGATVASDAATTMRTWEFPASTKGVKIKYRAELTTTTSAYTPVIQDIIFKYRLTPSEKDTNKQWTFGIILPGAPHSHLKLLDSTREDKTGSELRNLLWRSKQKDAFKFTNPEGEETNVVFDKLQIQGPYINQKNEILEYAAFVTLIEV